MGDSRSFSSITKLNVGADGRSSTNYPSWKFQVLTHLSTRTSYSFPLDSIVLGLPDGQAPPSLPSKATWLTANAGKTDNDFNAAVEANALATTN